jgi:hypothetical protein
VTLIEFLAKLDWFERVDEIFRAMKGEKSHRFAIDRWCGWAGQEIEDMLAENGIRIWGRAFDDDHLFFRVRVQQARWAEYLMARENLPMKSKPVDERNLTHARAGDGEPGFVEWLLKGGGREGGGG